MKTSRYVLTLMCALVLGSGVATAASSQPTGVSPWDSQASVQAPWLPQGAVSAGEAQGVQGEGLTSWLQQAWKKSYPVRVLWQAYQAYDLVGWELGRMLAVRDGLPDPGPKPNTYLLQKVIYQAAKA